MGKKVAVLIKDKKRQYEGLRCSLGLLLENHRVGMYVLNHEINLTEEYYDNMLFIDEMDGNRYSNEKKNIEQHGFQSVSLKDMAAALKDYEIVIPF